MIFPGSFVHIAAIQREAARAQADAAWAAVKAQIEYEQSTPIEGGPLKVIEPLALPPPDKK